MKMKLDVETHPLVHVDGVFSRDDVGDGGPAGLAASGGP